jgi:hypothetical protein
MGFLLEWPGAAEGFEVAADRHNKHSKAPNVQAREFSTGANVAGFSGKR